MRTHRRVHTVKYVDEMGREVWSEPVDSFKSGYRRGADLMLDHMSYQIIGSTVVDDVQVIKVRKVH
jgi:hypothetical protein